MCQCWSAAKPGRTLQRSWTICCWATLKSGEAAVHSCCSTTFRPLSCLLMHCLRYFSHIDRRRSNVPTSQPRALDDPYITESGDNLLDLKFSKLLLPWPWCSAMMSRNAARLRPFATW